MAFAVVPLDNAGFAIIVGRATPERAEFDSAEFNGTEMENGKFDGAVPPNTPVEANATGFVKGFEGPVDFDPVIG